MAQISNSGSSSEENEFSRSNLDAPGFLSWDPGYEPHLRVWPQVSRGYLGPGEGIHFKDQRRTFPSQTNHPITNYFAAITYNTDGLSEDSQKLKGYTLQRSENELPVSLKWDYNYEGPIRPEVPFQCR